MNGFGRTAILTMVSLLFLVTQSYAYTISFGGVNATQNDVPAGLTADKPGIDPTTNTAIQPGWFIETFDTENGLGGFTTLRESDVTYTGGGYGFAKGSVSGAFATPANDLTYYFYTPEQGNNAPASVTVDNSDFLAFSPNLYIDYLGLYFGSIDTYNSLKFNLIGGNSFTITGTEILNKLGGTSGNQGASSSNVYVNINFTPAEYFTSFTLETTGVALEIDNVVTHVSAVPEPSTLILFGAGLLGLVALGRKRFAQ